MPRVSFFARKNRKHFRDVGNNFFGETTYSRVLNKTRGNLILFRMFSLPLVLFRYFLFIKSPPVVLYFYLELQSSITQKQEKRFPGKKRQCKLTISKAAILILFVEFKKLKYLTNLQNSSILYKIVSRSKGLPNNFNSCFLELSHQITNISKSHWKRILPSIFLNF